MDLGLNVGFKNGLALWQRDYGLNVIFGKKTAPRKGNDVEIYFETENIGGAWDQVRMQEIEIVHELGEQPWGQRVFRVYDPDRFIVEFAEPLGAVVQRMHDGGMTDDEIAEKTTLPVTVVQQMTG